MVLVAGLIGLELVAASGAGMFDRAANTDGIMAACASLDIGAAVRLLGAMDDDGGGVSCEGAATGAADIEGGGGCSGILAGGSVDGGGGGIWDRT
jgi:hypothetical protein